MCVCVDGLDSRESCVSGSDKGQHHQHTTCPTPKKDKIRNRAWYLMDSLADQKKSDAEYNHPAWKQPICYWLPTEMEMIQFARRRGISGRSRLGLDPEEHHKCAFSEYMYG